MRARVGSFPSYFPVLGPCPASFVLSPPALPLPITFSLFSNCLRVFVSCLLFRICVCVCLGVSVCSLSLSLSLSAGALPSLSGSDRLFMRAESDPKAYELLCLHIRAFASVCVNRIIRTHLHALYHTHTHTHTPTHPHTLSNVHFKVQIIARVDKMDFRLFMWLSQTESSTAFPPFHHPYTHNRFSCCREN